MSIARPSPQQRFLELLQRDILKLDAAELDFGIYRILNYRRAQIQAFLNDKLPARIGRWADELAAAHGDRPLAQSEAENCYYHLHTFFSRYWDDGDFIPRARRGGTAAYAVPWNGQDTHFHWATKGSHYVKSGELFTRYAYRDGTHEVRFVIARADIAKDNAKGPARYFFPARLQPIEGGFELSWEWRPPTDAESTRFKNPASRASDAADEDASVVAEGGTLQDRLLAAWLSGADYKPAKPAKGLDPELLARNARRFVRRNTGDFFVHPQLGTFLRGELDVYLKHEFVQVWDAPAGELARIRDKFKLVRDIAEELIAFLDQIERFQATLFEKRKFVLQADYLAQCSWLLREAGDVGRALVEQAAGNAAQAAEWAHWVGDTANKPNGRKLLERYPHLPLHTCHFDSEFKARLLACFPDLEAALGGELVHADNYAALRTLEPVYRQRVKCIYIDPPYNTGGDGFLYKDDHIRSSWASMIEPRLTVGRELLPTSGVIFTSIDHNELHSLDTLCKLQFGAANRIGEIVWHNVTDNNPTRIANEHEYVLCYARDASGLETSWKNSLSQIKEKVVQVGDALIREHKQKKALQAAYSGWYRENRAELGPMEGYKFIDEHGIYAGSRSVHNPGKEGYRYDVIHPRTKKPCRQPLMGYRFPLATMQELLKTDRIIFGDDETKLIELKVYASEFEEKLGSVLVLDGRSGANDLRNMFVDGLPFKNPKPAALLERLFPYVLKRGEVACDYFAGSGTSGHAVINLNREDGGARKFLLVEQGEYFDSVTLPRIAKVMTSPDWKDGSPRDEVQHDAGGDPDHWSRRTLPLVRVLRLERYEDSLNALEFRPEESAGELPLLQNDADEHLLRYWLADDSRGAAVQLSTSSLADPFGYRLTLHEPTGPREATVDMVETARLLLGLVPRRHREVVHDGRRHVLIEASPASELARGTAEPDPVLLWLRPVADGTDAQQARAEHEWLATAVRQAFSRQLGDYATVYHNRGAFWPAGVRAQSIDALLAERMMERAH